MSDMSRDYTELLHFYVLNYDHSRNKVEMFNVFNNVYVLESSIEAIEEYRKDRDVEKLKDSILKAVKYEEYGRYQYEVLVGPFSDEYDKLEKWDCYKQFESNIDMFIKYLVSSLK